MAIPIPPPPVVLTPTQRKQLFSLTPEQVRMNELYAVIRDAEIMRDIHQTLVISALKAKGVYDKKLALSDLEGRFMFGADYNMLTVSANYEAKKRGYKKGYRVVGDVAELKKELALLIAGGEVVK